MIKGRMQYFNIRWGKNLPVIFTNKMSNLKKKKERKKQNKTNKQKQKNKSNRDKSKTLCLKAAVHICCDVRIHYENMTLKIILKVQPH